MRAAAFLSVAALLAASVVGAAPGVVPASSPPAASPASASGSLPREPREPRTAPSTRVPLMTSSASSVDGATAWAASLAPIAVVNRNTNARGTIRLYDDHGVVDRGQARAFMRIASSLRSAPEDDGEDDERLDLRVVQLAMRAAYHFGGSSIVIISASRPGARGKHATGEALDFALDHVRAPALAAYLRATPRAGVGIYTHPKTQYVHLDVRDHSYHWIDASPPGVTWREQLLADPKQAVRDASWSAVLDLPEPPPPAAGGAGRAP